MALPTRYLALCPRPTEPLCAAEIAALPGAGDIVQHPGAVAFSGPPAVLYRANLHLRTAARVLVPLREARCRGAGDLYDAAYAVPWEDYLRPGGTVAVSAHGQLPGLDNTMYTALRVKDAIVDRLRDRSGSRPDVDPQDPDLRVNVQLSQGSSGPRCALSLDSSGPALHQRGYRQGAGEAPMKENLAAAVLLLGGYGGGTLIDPLCGSGTLLIEGGTMALGLAPGRLREFGFSRWRGFDAALWGQVRAEAAAQARPAPGAFLYGSDHDARAIKAARRNAQAAGLGAALSAQQEELARVRPPPGPPGTLVCNPPYGERLGIEAELVPLYRTLGDVLKRSFTGWTAVVFTASLPLSRQIGLRPSARHVLYNGPLEGRVLVFKLY